MSQKSRTQEQSKDNSGEKIAAGFHWLFAFLFVVAFAISVVSFFAPLNFLSGSGWLEATLLILTTLITLTSAAQQLPMQNVLLAAVVIALIGSATHALNTIMEIPFGPLTFTDKTGPEIFKTLPWAIPLLWVVVVLNSRSVARLILRPWRKTKIYGFWVIGLTAALVLLFDFALEPFAARVKHYWIWTTTKLPVAWYGAPVLNFFVWGLLTLLILAFVTPALIKRKPSRKKLPYFYPLGIWLCAIAYFAAGCAAHGFWPAVGVDASVAVVTTVFAVRGATW
ncbi:MAG TPA: carotenoid biosynthesis protein [Verrucomicrobiae bacterium]|nr:carotenoid biosynthesis protein [Verrucomicrobiae bacterium]